MAGRKALPDKIKILKGTDQRCRMRHDEEIQAKGNIEPQDFIFPGAVRFFKLIGDELNLIGRNSRTFSMLATLAANRMQEIKDCTAIVSREGITVETTAGGLKTHPALAQRNDAQRHLQSLLADLGLTPTALGRIGKAADGEKQKQQGFGGL